MEIIKDYPCNPANYQRGRHEEIKYLVLHYVGATGGARANAKYYGNTPGIGASAHYFVGHAPGAEVWSSVPEDCVAWHCGRTDGRYKHPECRNANSIGIEMCCHQRADGEWYFDPETVDRTVELAREIMERYGIDTDHVLRHYDITGKLCPRPFVDDPEAWEAFKGCLAARKGEIDMSMDDVRALVNEAVERALADRDAVVAEAAQKVSPWAAASWGKAVDMGVFDGTRPGGTLTREQATVVFDRMGLLN